MVKKRYWSKVKARANDRVKVKNWRFRLVIFVSVTLVGFGIHWMVSGLDVAKNELGVIVIYAIAAVVVTPFISLMWHMLSEPALMDDGQEKKNNELESNLSDLESRISRKNIKPVWPRLKRVNNTQIELWMKIKNDSGKELSNYYARIEKVGFRKDQNEEIKRLDFPSDMKLRWPGSDVHVYREMDRPISPGDTAEISIAKPLKASFKLDTLRSIQNTFEEVGYYYVVLIVAGVVDEIGIDNCIQITIKYEGGKEIDIVDIIEYGDEND